MIIQDILLISNQRGILLQYPEEPSTTHFNYKSIHHLCFPECDEGTYNYFTVPSLTNQIPLYGVIIMTKNKQDHFNTHPDNPSESEIIGLCVLTHSPYLHIIKDHFQPLVELYFLQNNFLNTNLLISIFKALNLSFTQESFPLPNCCPFINRCGKEFLYVLKMMLLETRICINNFNSSDINSDWILTLLSFIPGILFPAPMNFQELGIVTRLKNTLIHCTLSELELLSEIEIFSATSFLFSEMAEFGLVINEKDIYIANKYKKIIELTKSDKQFMQQLLDHSKSLNSEKCYEMILSYIVGFLSVVKMEKTTWRSLPEYDDYGSNFISEFKKTSLFKMMPLSFSLKYSHPIKNTSVPFDLSEYISSSTMDVHTINGVSFPSYTKYE